MEITTYFKCSCANCGQIIEYLAREAGKIVECPKCKEKSQLPEPEKLLMLGVEGPPLPKSKNCPLCGVEMKFLDTDCSNCEALRKKKLLRVCGLVSAATIVVLGAVLVCVRHSKPQEMKAASDPVKPSIMILEQPQVSHPKSINDLKPGRFYLEQRRGSDLVMAVGDIENTSENIHSGLSVDVDLLDVSGAKIGTVTDYSVQLGPHQTWHFLVTVTNPKAKSVKIAAIKESQ